MDIKYFMSHIIVEEVPKLRFVQQDDSSHNISEVFITGFADDIVNSLHFITR